MISDLIYHLREDGEVKVPWEDEHHNAVSLTMPGELSNLFGDGATLSGWLRYTLRSVRNPTLQLL